MFSDPCGNIQIIRAQQGDVQAIEDIVLAYQPLLWALAQRLCCDWIGREELVQAGNIGFLHALRRYDAERLVKLSTYAVPWILGEMRKAMRRTNNDLLSLDEEIGEDGQTRYDSLEGKLQVNIGSLDLKLAISKLQADAQLLLCLRFFRDQTQQEAALLMGKSQAQISRLERRSLDALAYMLKES